MNPKAILKVLDAMSWESAYVVIERSPNGPKHAIAVCSTKSSADAIVEKYAANAHGWTYEVDVAEVRE
jgi:hypothetical protein